MTICVENSLSPTKDDHHRSEDRLEVVEADGFVHCQRLAAHSADTPCCLPLSSGSATLTQPCLYGKSQNRFPQARWGLSVLTASLLLACLLTSTARAGTFAKLDTAVSNTGHVSLLTLYPVLAAGEKPYSRFYYTVQTRTQQRVTVLMVVECSKGQQDTTRQRTLAFVASPKPSRWPVGVSPPFPDYCSVNLSFTGKGWLKAALWGAVR